MPLFNFEINLILTLSEDYFLKEQLTGINIKHKNQQKDKINI